MDSILEPTPPPRPNYRSTPPAQEPSHEPPAHTEGPPPGAGRPIASTARRDEPEPYYESSFCSVSIRLFKTRRRTYQISRIEKTEIRRPLLPILGLLGAALFGMTMFWRPYLLDGEAYVALGLGLGMVLIAINVGVLVVQSKALEENAMYGSVKTLRAVRAAIDRAIEDSEAANPSYGLYR